MRTYASAILIALMLLSGKSHASQLHQTALDNIMPTNKNPKTKAKKAAVTKKSDLAANTTKAVTVEELSKILNEMDAAESKEESCYLTEQLLNVAEDYKGVRYRFGGTSRSGMDCSGFVTTAFNAFDIALPRSSRDMAGVGDKIKTSEAQKGDLIFFKTGKKSRISHVGIIVETDGEDIKFIHSSTSQGVIVSSIKESYYQRTFAQINRVYDKKSL